MSGQEQPDMGGDKEEAALLINAAFESKDGRRPSHKERNYLHVCLTPPINYSITLQGTHLKSSQGLV